MYPVRLYIQKGTKLDCGANSLVQAENPKGFL